MSRTRRRTGDERLNRWTDKSNQYEKMDYAEHEPPNSVFPYNKKKKKFSKK